MTDAEVLRQINRRLDSLVDEVGQIREEQIRAATIAESIAPALDELVIFWKGSRILARILGTAAALVSLGVGGFVWLKDHIK